MHPRSTRSLRPLSTSLARFSSAAAIAAAMALAGSAGTQAVILDWDPDLNHIGGTGPWNLTGAFWYNGATDQLWVNANNDTAQFGLTPGTVTLGTGITAGGLNFNVDMTVTGNTLTLGGGTPAINVAGGVTATVSSTLAGTAGAVVTGGGTLILTQANSISGPWDIQAGLVRGSNYGALGSGAVTIQAGATLQYNTGNNGNLNNAITLNGGTLRQSSQNDLATQAPINVTAAGGTLETISANNYSKIYVNAGITGTGDLVKNGSNGILQIVQPNLTYSGNWTLNGGFIECQNPTALGTGFVTVNAGAELVASDNPIPNIVLIGSAGAILGFNNGNGGVFQGAINAAQNFDVGLRYFYDASRSANGKISGVISGGGAMNILNPNVPAKLTLTANNPVWNGAINVPSNVQLRAVVGDARSALGTGALTVNGNLVLITTPTLVAGPNAGFTAGYYSSALIDNGRVGGFDYGLVTPAAVRNEATIDLANGTGTIPNPAIPLFGQDHNAELWTGILNITSAGAYTFYTSSDDGSLLYLDGEQLVQNDFAQPVNERSGKTVLTPGLHSVIVKFGQGVGGGGMHAHYEGADTAGKVLIGSIGGTVTNNGTNVLGTNTISTPINLGANGTGGFELAATNTTVTSTLALQANFGVSVTGVTGYEVLTQAGPLTLNGAHTFTIGIDQVVNGAQNASAGADMVISGSIGEASAGSTLTKTGPRTLTLSGTNTFTGATTVINGTLQLNSPVANSAVGPGGLVINPTAGPVVVRLLTNEQMPNAAPLSLTSVGNNSALFDVNGFTETVGGVSLTGTSASPTGIRTGATGTLIANGDIVLNNNRAATGNTAREVLITGTGTYSVASSNGTLNLGGVVRNITVETTNVGANIPGSDATIETAIANGGINKLGSRTLIFNGASSYGLGTVINAGTVRGVGASGASSSVFGTGLITLKGGTLELRNNGTGSNGTISYGNNLAIDPSQPSGNFDVNNNGANTGNIISLGNLAIGTQTLNVTGGNSYGLRFSSATLSGNATVNLTTGATLTLNNVGETGGARSLTKSAASTGVLILSGAGTYTGGTVVPFGSGPLRLVPTIGTTSKPAGTGSISLADGTTLQIAPVISSLTAAGAAQGALSAKFYNGATTISGANYGAIPTATSSVALLSDGTFFNRPAILTSASAQNLLAVYSGLLNITDGSGTYTFQTAAADASQLVIDGVPVISVNAAGGSQVLTDSATSAPVTLGAGFHTIVMKAFNGSTTGGGFRVRYQGGDTGGAMQVIAPTRLYNAPALLNAGNSGAPVALAAATTVTLDGVGSDLDSSIATLTLGTGATLNAVNAGGSGALAVTGATTLQGAAVFNVSSLLTLTGVLGDGGGSFAVTKNGTGSLVLSGANTFGGTLTINAGGVQIANAAALGGAAGGTTVIAGATLDLNGTALGAEPLTLNGAGTATAGAALYNSSASAASASGAITIAAAGTKVGGFGDLTLSGSIAGAAGLDLTKIGAATLTLGNANTFSGAFTVSQGIVKLGDNSALGAVGTGTTVISGATLDLNGRTIAEPLTLSGTGLANIGSANTLGALINTSTGAATTSSTVALAAASGIGSSSLAAGAGGITVSGIISGSGTLTKVGGNTLTLSAINTHTGAVTVQLGTLILSGAGTLAAGTNAVTANPTATLTLDDAGTNNVGSRLGAKKLTLTGAKFNVLGNAGANTFEDLGTGSLLIDTHNAVVTLTPGGGRNLRFNATGTGATVGTSGLQRSNTGKGTALFRGTGLGTVPFGTGATTASFTFGGTIPTFGQNGGAGSMSRGIIPWALVDTAVGGSGTSFAAYRAENGLQALQAGEFDTTITNLTPIYNIVATTVLTSPTAGLTINSLTLKANSSLTIGAGNNLALDSGGLLATASVGITGAGSLTTTSNREIIVHTAGALTILTVATPIANSTTTVGGGGLTKAGDGMLTLAAQNTYTGQTRLNGGLTMLAGGANTIFNAVSTPPVVGATATASPTNNLLFVDSGATLDLSGNDQRVGGLANNAATGSNFTGTAGTITNTSVTTANFRFARGSNSIIPTVLAGKLNIQRDGSGSMVFTGTSTYTGTTTLTGGLLTLQDAGALVATSAFAIRRAALSIDNSGLQSAVRVNAAAPVALDGGAIVFVSRSGGTQDSLSLGAMSLNTGASLVQQKLGSGGTAATGASLITIASLTRSQGATINFTAVANNNVELGDNPRVVLGTGAPALTGGLVGGWATTSGYNSANPVSAGANFDFATYDAVTGFRPVSYATAFAPGNNVNLEPNNVVGASVITLPAGDTAINSLRIGGLGTTTGTTLAFNSASDVLNLQTGGLLSTGSNSPRAIGAAPDAGRLTAGGGAVGGTSELFIHNGASTLTVNAHIINNPNGAQVAVVLGALSKTSAIQLNGSNSYTGATYVNGVNVSLFSAGLAIPGNLVISGGTADGGESQSTANQTVTLLASNQIAPTANVTVNGGGALNLNGNSNTINNLTFAADGGGTNGSGPLVQTGVGALALTGGITATNLLQATTIPVLSGNLTLPAGVHTVAIGTFSGAPGEVGLQMNAAMTGGGSLSVTSGVLGLGGDTTSSVTSTASVNLEAGATMTMTNLVNLTTIHPTIGALTGSGKVSVAVTGTAQVQLVVGNGNSSGTFAGTVTGPISIRKMGTGTQIFTQSMTLNSLTIDDGGEVVFGDGLSFAAFAPEAGFGAAVVPEPGSLGLLALGFLGLLGRRRRG